MRMAIAALALVVGATTAEAGCGGAVAQCVHVDAEGAVQYNGLCARGVCANSSEVFFWITFPDGEGVRIGFEDDRLVVNGVPATELWPAGDLPSAYQTEAGDVYVTVECPVDCRILDADAYLALQELF